MLTTEMQKAVPCQLRDTPCHGGKGLWNARSLTGLLTETALIRFIHDDVLPPGSSIGDHTHAASENGELFEEWYLCLSGKGMMILDGREVPFEEGDINVCRGGGSHGVYNNSDEDLRILVICAKGRNAGSVLFQREPKFADTSAAQWRYYHHIVENYISFEQKSSSSLRQWMLFQAL